MGSGRRNQFSSVIFFTIQLLLLVLQLENCNAQNVLKLGCIYPFSTVVSGTYMQRLVEIAAKEVNDRKVIPNYNISVVFRDSLGQSVVAAKEVYSLLNDEQALGIIGDVYSSTTIASQRISTVFGAPQISNSATADELSDKTNYPTFMRVVPPDSYQARIIAQLVTAFGWSRVAFINSNDAYGSNGYAAFAKAAKDYNITILASVSLDFEESEIADSKAKIIIVFALPDQVVRIIDAASKLRLFDTGHAWIGSDGVLAVTATNFINAGKLNLISYMDGFFGTTKTSISSSGPEYTRFLELIALNNFPVIPPSGAAQYDIVLAYGEALNRMVTAYNIPENRPDLFTRSNLLQALYSISGVANMVGASGSISFDSSGNNYVPYDILNWRGSQGWINIGKWQQGNPTPQILFAGGTDHVNDDPLSGIISIGALFGLNKGSTNFASYQAAIDDVNEAQLIPNAMFQLVPDVQESSVHSITSAFEMISQSVVGIVGPTVSDICKPVAQVLGTFKVPQISPAASSPIFTDKTEFPYFARTTPSDIYQVNAFLAIIKKYGWKKVGYLYTNDDYGVNSFRAFEEVAKANEIEIVVSTFFSVSDMNMDLALSTLKKGKARIIIATVHTFACSTMLRTIIEKGFATKDFAWIHGDACSQFDRNLLADKQDDTAWIDGMPGMIGVAPAFGSGPEYEALLDRMVSRNYTFRGLTTTKELLRSHGYLTYSYDSIYAFTLAIKQVLAARQSILDGPVVLKTLLQVDFQGMSGRVQFDENGDRKGASYSILNWMNTSSFGYSHAGSWDSLSNELNMQTPMTWLGGGSEPPKDVPSNSKLVLILAIVIPVSVLIIAIIAFLVFVFRKKEQKERLLAGDWDDEIYDEAVIAEQGGAPEPSGLAISKKRLDFNISNTLKFPIDEKKIDHFTITNNTSSNIAFNVYAPRSHHKFLCKIFPGRGVLKRGESVEITVKMTLFCTTIIHHHIKVEIPGTVTRYSCVSMKFEGDMSDKLDPDELEIIKTLGKGAFGTVYKGTYRGTDVAIKMMHAQADYVPPETRLEFEKELGLLRKLKHPNVVSFVACSLIPNKMCLATEFCEGGELRSFMEQHRGNVSVAFKFRVLLDVAKGMAFLHTNGVFHRDTNVKPDNVLLVSRSVQSNIVAKISDFGTARSLALDQLQQPIYHTKAIGTPSYMAPELYMSQPYCNKVDVYSFGILMWEVLTEQFPFFFIEKPWDVAVYVISGKKNPIPADYPADVTELIENCWAQQPERRPPFHTIVAKLEDLFVKSLNESEYIRKASADNLGSGADAIPKFSKTKKRGLTIYSIKYNNNL